jgi:CRISPR-associated endoribonuclease Cas6
MPVSVVIELQSGVEVSLPSYTGRMVHGWFLDWVSSVDPPRAAVLHACRQVKPFTVSSLRRDRGVIWLRLTAFECDLANWLIRHLDTDLPEETTIDGVVYEVSAVHAEPGRHPWAGWTTYRDLVDHHLNGWEAEERVTLLFASPTTFRSGGVNVPIPLPDLVFGSLADRWAAYSPVALDEAIRVVTAGQVVISRYRLQTHAVQLKKSYQVGFTGSCEFTILAKNPYWRQVCALLADFAFYSGVGYKTTQGLGQTRRLYPR